MRFSPGCSCCAEPSDCTDCCDPPPPATLYATIAGLSPSAAGACGCVGDGDTLELTYVGGCQWQHFSIGSPLCSDGTANVCYRVVVLTCTGAGSWDVQFEFCRKLPAFGSCPAVNTCGDPGESAHTVSQTGVTETACDPLEVTFAALTATFGSPASFCGDVADITITVTE